MSLPSQNVIVYNSAQGSQAVPDAGEDQEAPARVRVERPERDAEGAEDLRAGAGGDGGDEEGAGPAPAPHLEADRRQVRARGHREDALAHVHHEGPEDRGGDGGGQGAAADHRVGEGQFHVAGMDGAGSTMLTFPPKRPNIQPFFG